MSAAMTIGPFTVTPDERRDLDIVCSVRGMSMRQYVIRAVKERLAADLVTYASEFETIRALRAREEEVIAKR